MPIFPKYYIHPGTIAPFPEEIELENNDTLFEYLERSNNKAVLSGIPEDKHILDWRIVECIVNPAFRKLTPKVYITLNTTFTSTLGSVVKSLLTDDICEEFKPQFLELLDKKGSPYFLDSQLAYFRNLQNYYKRSSLLSISEQIQILKERFGSNSDLGIFTGFYGEEYLVKGEVVVIRTCSGSKILTSVTDVDIEFRSPEMVVSLPSCEL